MCTNSSSHGLAGLSRFCELTHSVALDLVARWAWGPDQAVETALEFLDVVLQLGDLLGGGDRILRWSGLRGNEGATRLLKSFELELLDPDLVSQRVDFSVDLWASRDDASVVARHYRTDRFLS